MSTNFEDLNPSGGQTPDDQASLPDEVSQPKADRKADRKSEVPSDAAGVVAWLGEDGLDDRERRRRVDAAEKAERARDEKRSTVMDAIAKHRRS